MIPKRIYYVWLGGNPLPDKVKDNIDTWRHCNPDYEIIEINESNCDLDKYPFARQAYDLKYWAFASDVIRLATIYEYGGFYFDTDVKMLKSLDSLRNNTSVWAMENSGDINSGLIIGAQAGDQNLKVILDKYQQLSFDPDNIQNVITVPIVSEYFKTIGLKYRNCKQRLSDGTLVLPTKYFAPLHYWGGGHISKSTIAIQQYSATWGGASGASAYSRKTRLKRNLQLYVPQIFMLEQKLKRMILSRRK